MLRRTAVLGAVGVVVVAIVVSGVLVYQRDTESQQRRQAEERRVASSRRAVVAPGSLLVDGSRLTAWHGSAWVVDLASYAVSGDPPNGQARRWKGWDAADLRQHVIRFDTPVAADRYYRSHEPKGYLSDDFPGHVRDVSGGYPSRFADDRQLVCGHVGRSTTKQLEDCTDWSLWVRYGQYDMEVSLDTTDQGVPLNGFVAYARLFDDTTGRLLART
jgi:hypothetical protein